MHSLGPWPWVLLGIWQSPEPHEQAIGLWSNEGTWAVAAGLLDPVAQVLILQPPNLDSLAQVISYCSFADRPVLSTLSVHDSWCQGACSVVCSAVWPLFCWVRGAGHGLDQVSARTNKTFLSHVC